MADVLYLKDGTSEVVIGDEADVLRDLIETHLGRDCAESFDRCLQSKVEETVDEADDYEQDCEAYRSLCVDTLGSLDEAIKLFNNRPLDSYRIRHKIQTARDNLYKNL